MHGRHVLPKLHRYRNNEIKDVIARKGCCPREGEDMNRVMGLFTLAIPRLTKSAKTWNMRAITRPLRPLVRWTDAKFSPEKMRLAAAIRG